jgi:hypothetical protein
MTERELDLLIDRAVQSYVAEPTQGIETRVLARVRKPRYWLAYGAVAVAAAVLVTFWIPSDPGPIPPPPLVAMTPSVPSVPLVRIELTPKVSRRPKPLSPPLSAEERMLVQFVRKYPEFAQAAFVEMPKRMSEPIDTAPLVVAPLEASGSGGGQ